MLTDAHIMESLSRAYIQAVAGKAGLNVRIEQRLEFDYGIDGTFRPIKRIGTQLVESGFPLDFQVKASTIWQSDATHIIYDLEAKAYNKMVDRNSEIGTLPIILILFCLPQNSAEWLEHTEDFILLRKCCYWERLIGNQTENTRAIRVRISRSQQLNSESLITLLDRAKQGEWQ